MLCVVRAGCYVCACYVLCIVLSVLCMLCVVPNVSCVFCVVRVVCCA